MKAINPEYALILRSEKNLKNICETRKALIRTFA